MPTTAASSSLTVVFTCMGRLTDKFRAVNQVAVGVVAVPVLPIAVEAVVSYEVPPSTFKPP